MTDDATDQTPDSNALEEAAPEPQPEFDSLIEVPAQITEHLKRCFLEEERLEVKIGKLSRHYFSGVADRPPVDPREMEAEATQEPLFLAQSVSYLDEGKYLLLEPLEPVAANALVKKHPEAPLTLRLFDGMQTMQTEVFLKGLVKVFGEPALKVTFPESLGVFRQRRHFRSHVPREARLHLAVSGKDVEPFEADGLDISVGGMAFFHHRDLTDSLPPEKPLRLRLNMEGEETLELSAFVRANRPVLRRMVKAKLCRPIHAITAVQFDVEDAALERSINAYMGRIQQIWLAQRRKNEIELPREPKEKKSSAMDELFKTKNEKRKKILGF
ncbi:PilZ domain-containing protein [Magnetofaba australis]|uniref:PilZ domain-containing protein n=1 Tax=Magnetofaba australis IT-1 TaxID=1434232 RepID=A0A1Y2K5Y7_9PROT|nr:PilZ domain-containing protein [Magnetofaba australis]OSM05122.1 hypothetical protein MAIT1_03273 [Magnetofaba australis IT-1]